MLQAKEMILRPSVSYGKRNIRHHSANIFPQLNFSQFSLGSVLIVQRLFKTRQSWIRIVICLAGSLFVEIFE